MRCWPESEEESLWSMLANALRDRYNRAGPKESKNDPRKKQRKKISSPKIAQSTQQQIQWAQELTQRNKQFQFTAQRGTQFEDPKKSRGASMTVERYKWNCPGCGQTFGIKKGTAAPSLCPECSKKRQPVSPQAVRPVIETAGKTVEFTIPDLPSIEEEPLFLQGLSSSETSSSTSIKTSPRRSSRGKYASLRKLSTFYQFLALLILVGSGIGTIFAISNKVGYWYAGAIFGAGIVFSLILSGFGVILRIVIDIEANTRER